MKKLRKETIQSFITADEVNYLSMDDYILINENTIRKEPASKDDPFAIELKNAQGEIIGKFINSSFLNPTNSTTNPTVSIWSKI